MIVLGTVLLNATTARLMAKALGVFLSKSEGILIIGAGKLSRLIGEYLDKNNRHVVLVDTNASNIEKANELGKPLLVFFGITDRYPGAPYAITHLCCKG